MEQLEVYKGLVEVSALINGISDSRELLPAILDVARRIMHAEAASLFLVRPDGDLELDNASGDGSTPTPKVLSQIIVPRGRGISGWVLTHGTPLLIRDAYADPRFYQEIDRQTGFRTRSILCAPLVHQGKEIGVLQLLNPVNRQEFDEADLEAFNAFATLAATAIDKLRSIEQQILQERIDRDIALAREIQASFLPQTLPMREDLEFAAAYRPALTVGGDFYDVIAVGPDEIYFVIGDVSGKGIPAALLMAQALSILRLILRPGIDPAEAVQLWNSELSARTIRGMFITVILGRITVSRSQVELCSAGHCHPLLSQPTGTRAVELPACAPLGILPALKSESQLLEMVAGEWLVLYTDGLVESFSEQNQWLEVAGATRLLEGPFATASELVDALQCGELAHRQPTAPQDDLTLLVFGFR